MEESNEFPIDIENQHDHDEKALETSMNKDLHTLADLSPSRCIYRVATRLREANEKAYTPQVVSIGPLHHDDEHLKAMEEHKMRYVNYFLDRTGVRLASFIQKVRVHEVKLRNCYAEHFKSTSDEFVRLILVDALFLIELLLRDFSEERSKDDYIFSTPLMKNYLWSDLAMLENQLPFFILEYLWEGTVTSRHHILWHAYRSFWIQICSQEPDLQTLMRLYHSGLEVNHFVDVIRNLFQPMDTTTRGELRKSIPSMTQLDQAGVKFKVRLTDNLLDIHFDKDKGVLEIPQLQIQDSTENTIRNLVAYEQCHYPEEAYISDYVVLMDDFLNTPKDVELLVENEILTNMLGDSSEVSTLINNLGKWVTVDYNNFYFAKTCDDLKDYCEGDWHKWKATLKKKYFNTPWAAISVGAAILLLMLTITQTVFSIISVV